MRRPVASAALVAALALVARTADAADLCGLGALQTGPLGAGLPFVSLERPAIEARAGVGVVAGREASGPAALDSSARVTTSELAGAYPLGGGALFQATATGSSSRFEAVTRGGGPYTEELSGTRHAVSAGPTVWFGDLLLGGAVGVVSLGEEERQRVAADGQREVAIDDALLPSLSLVAALRSGAVLTALRVDAYDDAWTDATITDEGGNVTTSEVRRRLPLRAMLDGRLRTAEAIDWGLSISYAALARAVEAFDEAPARTDRWELGVGGAFHAPAGLVLATSLRHAEPTFVDPRGLSHDPETLGTTRLAVGLSTPQDLWGAGFDAAYAVSGRRSYTNTQGRAAPWKDPNGRTKTELKGWDLRVFAGAHF